MKFHTFFEFCELVNEGLILEGGHTFPNVGKIKKQDIQPTLDAFFEPLYKKLGITSKDIRTLGSVGKKSISGDIDMLIDGEVVAKKNGIHGDLNVLSQKVPQLVFDIMDKEYGDKYLTNYTPGLKVANIAFPIHTKSGKTDEFVQIDLMTAFGKNALEFGSFYYHSPDLTKGESKYSGGHRSTFLRTIFRFVELDPLQRDEQYFDTEYDGKYKGQLKSFNKMSLIQSGLMKQLKTFVGKTKPTKNPKTAKEFDKLVSENPEEIMRIALGPNATVKDANSFESLFEFIESGKNKDLYKKRKDIYKDWAENMRQGLDIPDEIKKYI